MEYELQTVVEKAGDAVGIVFGSRQERRGEALVQ